MKYKILNCLGCNSIIKSYAKTDRKNNVRFSKYCSKKCYLLHKKTKLPLYEIGNKYSKLTIIEIYNNLKKYPRGNALCKCKCECGNEYNGLFCPIKNGRVKSCGCLRQSCHKKGKYNICYTGYEELSGKMWSDIISKAKNRNIEVKINIKEAYEQFIKQSGLCALSGRKLIFSNTRKTNTASLDRIDSLKDYTIDNVQWVHKDINIAKNKMSDTEFIKLCKDVAYYRYVE